MNRWSRGGILAAVGALVVAAACARLGFWQLDRLDQRRDYNAALERAADQPPVQLSAGGLSAVTENPSAYLYRPATARGVFEPGTELLLRGRSHLGRPGVHLVSLLELTGGGAILVNRGWLPAPDGATVDPRPYRTAGEHQLIGTLQLVPDDVAGATPLEIQVDGANIPTYLRLDRTTLSSALDTAIPPLYLQLLAPPGDATLPVEIPPADLDEGPHLGYAVQWFAFAAIALFGFVFVLLGGPARLRSPQSFTPSGD